MKKYFLPVLAPLVLALVTMAGCGPNIPLPPPKPDPPPAPTLPPPPAAARSLQVTNSTKAIFIPPGPNAPGKEFPPFRIVPIIYTSADTTDPNSAYSKARTAGTTADQLRSSDPNETFSGVPIEPTLVSAVKQLTPGQASVALLVVGLDSLGRTDGVTYATSNLSLHDGLNAITVTGTFSSPLSISGP
jgi:hypothetical protein